MSSRGGLEKAYTIKCSARCSDKVVIKWSDRNQNWQIFWRNSKIPNAQLKTGERLSVDKVAKIIREIKTHAVIEKMKKYREAQEHKEKKKAEEEEDRSRYMAKEWVTFGGRGRKSFKIGK